MRGGRHKHVPTSLVLLSDYKDVDPTQTSDHLTPLPSSRPAPSSCLPVRPGVSESRVVIVECVLKRGVLQEVRFGHPGVQPSKVLTLFEIKYVFVDVKG